jgi:phosphoribosylformylglycinamidine synthase
VKVGLRVTVMKKPGVLDPEGKAIGQALRNMGFGGVEEVRAGKVIELDLEAESEAAAEAAARQMAEKLLANGVIERFRIERIAAA